MTKSRKVNDLTQLPELFVEPESEPELGFGLMLEEEQNKPEPVQDIHDAVLGLMYNYRGWTVHDVQLRLPDHPECYLVPTIMAKYAADGRLEAVRGANGILTFTLKKKILDTTITAHRAKRVHREPNVRLAPDPKGVIRPEEGLDIGIWKVMSDYKPNSKNSS